MKKKPKIKHLKLKIFSIITVIVLCTIGITFAYFTATITGNEKVSSVTLNTGKLDVTFTTSSSINETTGELEETSSNKFTVTNNSKKPINFDVYLTNVNISKLNSSDFHWQLLNGTSQIANGNASSFVNNQDVKLNSNALTISANSSSSYEFKVWIANTSTNQSNLYEGTFSGKIKVVAQSKRS